MRIALDPSFQISESLLNLRSLSVDISIPPLRIRPKFHTTKALDDPNGVAACQSIAFGRGRHREPVRMGDRFMKALIAALSLSLFVWTPATEAQEGPVGGKDSPRASIFGRKMSTAPPEQFSAGTGEKIDEAVIPASNVPTPAMPDQLKPATVAIPAEPIEPYLLTKDVGPFMVMARTFRGPEAQGYALALAKELVTCSVFCSCF